MLRALALVWLAACGRYGFGHSDDAGSEPERSDASTPTIDARAADAADAADAAMAGGSDAALPVRHVFVTPTAYLGGLSGMSTYAALDANCTTVANDNGLAGNYAVVLAFAGMDASAHVTLAQGRTIVLVNGTQVATDTTFFTATHLAPIDIEATGTQSQVVTASWTNFQPDGTALTDDCTGWTDSSSGSSGGIGSIPGTDATWANNGTAKCNRTARLICIEQ